MSDVQHKEWFIAVMLPHLHTPLRKQNILSHSEALYFSKKLEASPVGETGEGMIKIQLQISNLTLQL